MAYRLAQALINLRTEVNRRWPTRDKTSDGWIGDTAHTSRKSDHNPWVKDKRGVGVVRAYDVDAGPGSNREVGIWIAEHVRYLGAGGFRPLGHGAYVISQSRIASDDHGWVWRKYLGSNPHDKHTHVSVGLAQYEYDCTDTWGITNAAAPSAGPIYSSTLVLQVGSKGDKVKELQRVLNRWYKSLPALVEDGVFGKDTRDRVMYLQTRAGLVPDGVVGPRTKAVLHI